MSAPMVKHLPVDEIKPYQRNPRKIPEEAVEAVAESIRQYGFRQPIVIDRKNTIIVGHTRWLAAKRLGLDQVPVIVANLDEKAAQAYRIADNRTH